MKLESLKLEKFKNSALKREQLFMLNGGGVRTDSGTVCGPHAGKQKKYDYGYDIDRGGNLTFHNRSNVRNCPK